jgi:hypothetical protein
MDIRYRLVGTINGISAMGKGKIKWTNLGCCIVYSCFLISKRHLFIEEVGGTSGVEISQILYSIGPYLG